MNRHGEKTRIGLAAIAASVFILPLAFLACPAHADKPVPAVQPIVDKFVLDDTIQPVSADELKRAIRRANADGASALLIQMDTPGGMVESMRAMVGDILASHVPVIVYVGPSGARAGSAGFFILESADVAAMAPGTEAGAAHVVFELGKPDSTEMQKVENDAEAFLRSYVKQRNRNTEAAAAALQSSHSYTAQEALDQHLIDVVSSQESELLQTLDGRVVTRFDGSKVTLHTAGAHVEVLQPTLRDNLLGWLVNPNIALLLLFGGGLLIYLEFNVPGTIVPGALGTLMVLLAIFALDLLPIRYTAVLLIVAALALMLLEAKFGGHGALAIAGIVCLTFGMLTLVAAPVPEMGVSPLVAIAAGTAFGGITIFLAGLVVRSQRRKARLGADALIGARATAMEPLSPVGHILVDGEIWQAVASEALPAGAPLTVVGHDHMLLRVEPLSAQQSAATAV